MGLPETEDAQAQKPSLDLGIEYTSDGVALAGPDMEHAFALACNGRTGGGEIEEELAILEGDRPGCVGECTTQEWCDAIRYFFFVLSCGI